MTVPLGIGILRELEPESLVERHGTSEIGHDQSDDVQLRHLRIIATPEAFSRLERSGGARITRTGLLGDVLLSQIYSQAI